MVSTRSLAYSASVPFLIFFLFFGRGDSKAVLPAFDSHSSSDLHNSCILELNSIAQAEIDVEDEPPDWGYFRKNGVRLDKAFKAIEAGDGDRKTALSTVYRDYHPQQGRLLPAQKQLLIDFDMTTDTTTWFGYDFRGSMIEGKLGPTWDDSGYEDVHLNCEVSAWNGVIIVTDWRRDPEADSGALEADILWAMWEEEVQKSPRPQHKLENPSIQANQIDDLTLIIFDPLSDSETLELLKYAIGSERDKGVSFKFPKPDRTEDAAKTEAYWALLGSPAGAVVMSLLIEHKDPLFSQRVDEIFAYFNIEPTKAKGRPVDGPKRGQYGLVFKLGYSKCG